MLVEYSRKCEAGEAYEKAGDRAENIANQERYHAADEKSKATVSRK